MIPIGDEVDASTENDLVHWSTRTRVSRRRLPDGRRVICKQPLGPDAGQRLTHERSVLERLAGVAGVAHLVPTAGDGLVVVEDVGGTTLADHARGGALDPHEAVRILQGIAAALAAVHRRGIVHRDVNPANVVLAGAERDVVLVDFDLAATFTDNRPGFVHQRNITGTLPYLAPEQTGRSGRPVDQRADLYAVGVTAYELVTGHLPFPDGDALQLIRDHLTRVPAPVVDVRPGVAPALSAIVARLLEKEPDCRYQSAEGLAHDLARLRAGDAGPFPLGERDFPVRLLPPSRPIGRERELALLRQALDGAAAGTTRAVLISGPPGVGKTALVDELRPGAAARGGWFVTGKFDQYRRDSSADAITQALRSLGRLLRAEPDLDATRSVVAGALGTNAGLLAGIVPEIGGLLGVPAEVPDADPIEVGARVLRAGCDLLGAVASPRRPLVIAVDDLQWAGAAPISFIDAVLTDDSLTGVLLVASYREEQLDPAHPLVAAIERWNRLGTLARHLALANLAPTDVAQLLTDMLRLPAEEASALADAVGGHAGGNPYDTIELLNALRRDGALELGPDGWTWDAAAISGHLGVGDVVERLRGRVGALAPPTRELVEVLGCLGGEVDRELLARAAGHDPRTVVAALAPALEDALLAVGTSDGVVRFRHDRVHQAVYQGLAPARRSSIHLAAARRLAADPERASVAAEQYLAALEPGGDDPGVTLPEEERPPAAALFLAAANGVRLVDPRRVERLLGVALELLGSPPVEPGDAFVLSLRAERHSALYRLGRHEEADREFARIAAAGLDPIALVDPTRVQVNSLTNRGRPVDALQLGLDLLARLGLERPDEVLPAVLAGLDSLAGWVAGLPDPSDPAPVALRPQLEDPRLVATAKLLERTSTAAYFGDLVTHAWLSLQCQRLWVEHGPSPWLLQGLGATTTLLIAFRGDLASAHLAHRHILELGEAHGYEPATSTVRNMFVASVQHWHEPLEDGLSHIRRAREGLLRGGDLQFAGFNHNLSAVARLELAGRVETLAAEVDAGLAFQARTGNDNAAEVLVVFRQLVRGLRGETGAPVTLAGPGFDPQAHEARVAGSPLSWALYHVYAAVLAAVFGDVEALARHAGEAMAGQAATPGFYPVALTHALQGLALAERVRRAGDDERPALLAELDAVRGWLAARAADAPDNFAHLVAWIDAERAWAAGEDATGAFDGAMRAVETRARPWHRALIVERAGAYHLARGLGRTGFLLLGEARGRWEGWGALGKVRQLDRAHPGLRPSARAVERASVTGGRWESSHVTTNVSSDAVDLLAVLEASQALSSETSLERLHRRVVEVLRSLTGATDVQVLLLNDDSESWYLPPTAAGSDGPARPGASVEEAAAQGLLPLAAFRYVERTGEVLVVPDACHDDRLARDPYLAGLDGCSLLLVPIHTKGAPRAILVLENTLSAGVFTGEQLGAVELIAGQLVVSLDNAMAERFRRVVQRSSELTLVCGRDGTVTYASTASVTLLGVDDAALVGRPVLDLVVDDDDRAALGERLRWVAAGAVVAPGPCECRALMPDGSYRWVDITLTDLLADPAVSGIVLTLRDVTERRRLEGELRHAQKLESVGQLAAGIAHEINTPIQFVGDNVRFLRESFEDLRSVVTAYAAVHGADDPAAALAAAGEQADEVDVGYLDEDVPRAITEALDGLDRMATIVRAMRAFGQPTAAARAPADLNEAIANTLVVANSQIARVADVVTDLAELPPVWCNLGDINQVLLNLVVNAAQAVAAAVGAGGDRGTIVLTSRLEGTDVVIEIRDTGVGIPPEHADRVFEPFFTTREVGSGSGQGLTMAYSLVHDHHGGTISFTSEPGRGTVFVVRLPVGAPAPVAGGAG